MPITKAEVIRTFSLDVVDIRWSSEYSEGDHIGSSIVSA